MCLVSSKPGDENLEPAHGKNQKNLGDATVPLEKRNNVLEKSQFEVHK